jgi:hypothetical protein
MIVLAAAGFVSLLAGLFLHPSQAATTQTFKTVADAYVSQKTPNSNYGAKTSLKAGASPLMRSYLRFSVAALAGQVTRATLRLYETSSSTTGQRSEYGEHLERGDGSTTTTRP